jgi:NADH-quinone oxidoreductase subunit C
MAEEPKPDGPVTPEGKPESAPADKPAPPKAEAKPAPKATPPAAAAGGHPPAKPTPPMASTPWEGELPTMVKERFGADVTEAATYLGQNFFVVKPDQAMPLIEFLKLEADFDYLVDITAVDFPKRPERFDVVYILYSFARNERIRIKTLIADGYKPQTAVNVHLAANWLEREVFDMFGIQFAGHPDMRRILLPEEWEGFPLRREYGLTQQDDRWVKENLGIESGH